MSRSEKQGVHKGSRPKAKKPFTRLIWHSIERVMRGGDETGEIDVGVGAMLALLAAPGAYASILILAEYGNVHLDAYAASLPDEYFFIALTMVVTGVVAVWKWDALIPNRRDYMNLAPLPIPAKHILYANLTAVLLVAAALGFDVNVASSVLFPLVADSRQSSFGYTAVFFATHVLSVLLASVFSFFIVLAILGLVMAVLPYRAFRRCSVYIRCGMAVFLMAVLSTSFEVSSIIQDSSSRLRPLAEFLPPVWFLGLCQHLRGLRDAAFGMLAKTAILASVAVPALAIAAYALSYRRCFTKSAESIAGFAAAGGSIRHRKYRATDLFLRTPFERGCFSFTLKTLFRSENHMLIVGGFAGVGILLASETLFPSAGAGGANRWPSAALLSIPLIVLYLLLIGLRFSFEIPALQKANWIFRLRTNLDASECVGLARKIMLTFLIPPLLLIALPAYGFIWGWRVGAIHTAIVAASLMLLIEILLVRLRKIPFTCSAPHFKRILVSMFFCFLGFVVVTSWVPIIELRASEDPLWYLGFILTLTAIWVGLAFYRRVMTRLDSQVVFEELSDVGDVAIEVLNLSWVAREHHIFQAGSSRFPRQS